MNTRPINARDVNESVVGNARRRLREMKNNARICKKLNKANEKNKTPFVRVWHRVCDVKRFSENGSNTIPVHLLTAGPHMCPRDAVDEFVSATIAYLIHNYFYHLICDYF